MLPALEPRIRGTYTCKVFPSGDFAVSKVQPKKRDTKEDLIQPLPQNYDPDPELLNAIGDINLYKQLKESLDGTGQALQAISRGAVAYLEEDGEDQLPYLSLVDASKSHKKANRRGLNGLTTDNKKYIKSAYTLLERRWGKPLIQWGCASLPPMPDHELEIVSANWATLIKQFMQELGRLRAKYGLSPEYLHVTEVQEKRYRKYGKVCLHLHWVTQSKLDQYKKGYPIDGIACARIWGRLLSNVLGRHVDASYTCKVKMPTKSLQAELGKYMSKGGALIKEIVAAGLERFLPRAYVGMSNSIRHLVTANIVFLEGEAAQNFVGNLEGGKEAGLLEYRPIYVEWKGREVLMGYTGWVYLNSLGIVKDISRIDEIENDKNLVLGVAA